MVPLMVPVVFCEKEKKFINRKGNGRNNLILLNIRVRCQIKDFLSGYPPLD
jgi:hypothetical protein